MTKARSPTTRTIQPANGKTRIGTGYLLSRRHTKWRATPCRPDSFLTSLAAKTCCRQGRRACRRRSGTVQGQRPARAGPRGSIVPLRRRRARRTRRRALRPRRHWLITRCAVRYAARLVHGDAHARARMCGQRARHATRAAGSVVAATADAVADAQSGVVDVVETQGGGLWRTTVQGSLRRWKNLVILKHKLDVRADAGVAT